MAPTEGPSKRLKNQERTKSRRPRTRRCLLKGCGKRFRPEKALERYCSDECRDAARQWSLWKAQLQYRSTQNGKDRRKEQCRRNRKRVKNEKNHKLEAANEAARVITIDFFSIAPATGPGATRCSGSSGDHRSNASVQRSAGELWNGSGSGNGDGRKLLRIS